MAIVVDGTTGVTLPVTTSIVTSGSGTNLTIQAAGTTAMTVTTAGGVAFGTSASAYGTSGQVLTSTGNAAPVWQTAGATGSTLFLATYYGGF
jgi:hypothetical protein